jgi:hypothetical protein
VPETDLVPITGIQALRSSSLKALDRDASRLYNHGHRDYR